MRVKNHYSGTHGKSLFIYERCEYKAGYEKILKNHYIGWHDKHIFCCDKCE